MYANCRYLLFFKDKQAGIGVFFRVTSHCEHFNSSDKLPPFAVYAYSNRPNMPLSIIDVPSFIDPNSPRFMDQVKLTIRKRGLAYKTEKNYCLWIRRFINFHKVEGPTGIQPHLVESFLSSLAYERQVSINTQRTALNALAFLFRDHLHMELGNLSFNYANHSRKLPVVLSNAEANI